MGAFGRVVGIASAAIATIGFGVLITKSLEATKNFQRLNAQLVIATGSTSGASAAFERLQKFAAKTPFSLNQSVEGFIKLKNLGLDPSERAMMSFGNTASSMGKDMMQMVEAVADATTGEFERLKEFGIKSQSEGNKVKFTFAGVTTAVGKNSREIQDYLISLGETKFAGAMDLQSKTLAGSLSALGDSVDNLLVKFGSGFAPTIQSGVEALAGVSMGMDEMATNAGRLLGTALTPLVAGVTILAENIHLLGGAMMFLAGGVLAKWIAGMAVATANAVRMAAAHVGLMAALSGTSVRAAMLTTTMGGLRAAGAGVLGVLGGPLGIALGAAAVAIGYFAVESMKTSAILDGLDDSIKSVNDMYLDSVQKAGAAGTAVNFSGEAASIANPLMYALSTAVNTAGNAYIALGQNAQWAAMQTAQAAVTNAKLKEDRLWGAKQFRFSNPRAGAVIGKTMEFFGGTTEAEFNAGIAQAQAERATAQAALDNYKNAKPGAFAPPKPPTPAASGGKTKTGSKDAVTEAERRAEAERKFWAALENSKKEAALVGLALAQHNKELELKNALFGDDVKNQKALTNDQKARISGGLIEAANAQALTDLGELSKTQAQRRAELERERLTLSSKGIEDAEDQLKIDQLIGQKREEYLRNGATLGNAVLENALKAAEADERRNLAIERQNALLANQRRDNAAYVDQLLKDAQTRKDASNPYAGAQRRYDKASLDIRSSGKNASEQFNAMVEAGEQFQDDTKQAGRQFLSDVSRAGDQIADAIGGSLGRGIGALVDLVGSLKSGASLGDIGRNSNASGARALSGLSDAAASIGGMFKEGGAASKAFKGISSTLGNMGGGAAIGGSIAGIAKAFGFKKFSNTGAQIGGAIGQFGGPVGTIVGSIAGGLIGAAFKKAKTGSSSIQMGADGILNGDTLTGNNSKMKAAAGGAADSVISGLYDIASRLGGDLNGNPSVSIGLRDGKYRVDTSGAGNTKTKKGAVDFGKNGAEEAIAFAIKDAIKDGVITGLSSFSTRLLQSAKNLDSAVSLSESYEKLLKDLAAIDNPIKASVDNTIGSLNKMAEMMRKNAATQEEIANVERYKTAKLDELRKDSVSTLRDFMTNTLNGEGSGVTAKSRLESRQAEFAEMQKKIAGGGQVDQDAFTSLAGEINSLASGLFGTATGAYQTIRAQLIDATGGAIDNVTKAFNDATVVAITQQTNAITQAVGSAQSTNDALLAEILAALNGGSGYSGYGGQFNNYV